MSKDIFNKILSEVGCWHVEENCVCRFNTIFFCYIVKRLVNCWSCYPVCCYLKRLFSSLQCWKDFVSFYVVSLRSHKWEVIEVMFWCPKTFQTQKFETIINVNLKLKTYCSWQNVVCRNVSSVKKVTKL